MATSEFEKVFNDLIDVIHEQRTLIHTMAGYIKQLQIGGGGSGNGFQVYESGKEYKRYQALIDPNTDIAYLVVPRNGDTYISETVQLDCESGNLKLLGFDGQIVTFNHPPKPDEVDVLPENVVVVEYSEADTPYTSILTNDNTPNNNNNG